MDKKLALLAFALVSIALLFLCPGGTRASEGSMAVVRFELHNQTIHSEVLSSDPSGLHEVSVIWECTKQGVSGDIWNFGLLGVTVLDSTGGPYGNGRWDAVWWRPQGSSCVAGDTATTTLAFEASPGDTVRWAVTGEVYRPLHHGDLRLLLEKETFVLQ